MTINKKNTVIVLFQSLFKKDLWNAGRVVTLLLVIVVPIAFIISNPYDLLAKNDPWEYSQIAYNVYSTEGISLNTGYDVVLPPGYPLLVGLVNNFVHSPWSSMVFIGISSLIISIMLINKILLLLKFELNNRLLGLVLFGFNSQILIHSGRGYAELSMVALTLLMIWTSLLVSKKKDTNHLWSILLGSEWALMYLIKPEGAAIGLIIILCTQFNKSIHFKLIATACFIVLVLPYGFFLKNQTGVWQLSGKTYVNLVLGEMNSPYQGSLTKNDRYDVISRVWDNPEEAGNTATYLRDNGLFIFERIPHNAKQLVNYLFSTYSLIGIIFAIAGLVAWKSSQRKMIILNIGLMLFYLVFFITPRVLVVYHIFFTIGVIAGVQVLSEKLLNENKLWIRLTFYGAVFFLIGYQARSAIKYLLQNIANS